MFKFNKSLSVVVAALAVMVVGVATVGAQENGRGGRGAGSELVQEYTGLTGQEIREALSDGETTLADLIEANGESVDAYIDEAVDAAEARLDAAVENGRLTEDEAAEKLAELETRITERVNSPFDGSQRQGRGEGKGPRGGFGAPNAEATAEADA